MDSYYNGDHSIIFGTKHSWDDWALIPSERPVIELPSVNTMYVNVPGSNGRLDLTEVLLGFPTYKNRSGSWKFHIAHDKSVYTWERLYEEMASYLHGRHRTCVLTDDPAYYYEGRFTVEKLTPAKLLSNITVKYDLDPFKWLTWTTCGDWLWDPFDFVYGVITKSDFANLRVNEGETFTKVWTQSQIGMAPVTPVITVNSTDGSSGMTLKVNNRGTNKGLKTFTLQNGRNENPLIMLSCPDADDTTYIEVTGNGTISFDFRPGRL